MSIFYVSSLSCFYYDLYNKAVRNSCYTLYGILLIKLKWLCDSCSHSLISFYFYHRSSWFSFFFLVNILFLLFIHIFLPTLNTFHSYSLYLAFVLININTFFSISTLNQVSHYNKKLLLSLCGALIYYSFWRILFVLRSRWTLA